ncbi:AAA family ATPase [Natronomonas salina]|uniref:adenylate kinase family protein n=1 Tax=Natronomonas salina TaxID=1710540 RepID=UPI0015B5765A|nr:adenylate kinase family protein [Natronomonas salina]QLD87645.1 AAA family ATPase [Natronomonas salina]
MRVAVTGTPGTGKTTASKCVDADLEVVHLNDLIREEGLAEGEDPERGSLVADLEAVRERMADRDDVLVESHLAHHLDADRVVVLRCHPRQLRERLLDRGEDSAKAAENAEAEALDVVLSEAVDAHGLDAVYEIDTTDRDPEAVADAIEAVVAGDREPSAGDVDFLDYL